MMVYLQLFLSFAKIGLFGFGGGLAILSLIQHEVVAHAWMEEAEFVNIVAISQVTPGPIGINCATYVGYTTGFAATGGTVWGGVLGSALATFAIILPSLIIMLSICKLYFFLSTRFQTNPYFQNSLRMLRFAVLGLIAAAALVLIDSDPFDPTVHSASFIDWTSWVFFAVVFLFTILPQLVAPLTKTRPHLKKCVEKLSHPILLIVLAGVAGYVVYG